MAALVSPQAQRQPEPQPQQRWLDDYVLPKDFGKDHLCVGHGTYAFAFYSNISHRVIKLPLIHRYDPKDILHQTERSKTSLSDDIDFKNDLMRCEGEVYSYLQRFPQSPHIIQCTEIQTIACTQFTYSALTLEYGGVSLRKWLAETVISTGKALKISQAQLLSCEILKACQALRERFLLHLDISLNNLLISPDTLRIKLGDFGSADQAGDGSPFAHSCYTITYRPPEGFETVSFSNQGPFTFDYSSDLWAAMCCILELWGKRSDQTSLLTSKHIAEETPDTRKLMFEKISVLLTNGPNFITTILQKVHSRDDLSKVTEIMTSVFQEQHKRPDVSTVLEKMQSLFSKSLSAAAAAFEPLG